MLHHERRQRGRGVAARGRRVAHELDEKLLVVKPDAVVRPRAVVVHVQHQAPRDRVKVAPRGLVQPALAAHRVRGPRRAGRARLPVLRDRPGVREHRLEVRRQHQR